MPKRIIVFADGTGNAFTTQQSNVWRLFETIDQSQPDQIARYIPGVGTSGFRPFALLDGATGIGVPANVRKLYRFICWNWKEGDEIWMFGFSRGAFTVRALVGLIHHEGLVPAQIGGEQVSLVAMERNAMAAWRSYREKTAPNRGMFPTVWLTRRLRDLALAAYYRLRGFQRYAEIGDEAELQGRKGVEHYERAAPRDDEKRRHTGVVIRFLGVFDTVEAFGVPFEELRRAIDKAIWPISFRTTQLSSNVAIARHALALDDERLSFHPIRFDPPKPNSTQSIEEVWFAGVHSDVGGGYPDGALSYLPLIWMAEEADQNGAGLRFLDGAIDAFRREASPFGRFHDSRSGLASAYRYAPRRIDSDKSAVVHHSVLEKMALGSERYAPVPMPDRAVILMPDRSLAALGPDSAQAVPQLDIERAQKLFPQFASINRLPAPNETFLELMRAKVWWRRIAYLALLWSSIATLALPWIAEGIAAASKILLVDGGKWLGFEAQGRWLWAWLDTTNNGLAGSLGMISGSLGSLVPSYAGRWVSVLVESSLISLIVILTTILLYRANNRLRDDIADAVHCAWSGQKTSPQPSLTTRLGLRAQRSGLLTGVRNGFTRWIFPAAALAIAFALLLVGLNDLTIGYKTGHDGFCTASSHSVPVPESDVIKVENFDPASLCWPSGVLLEAGRSYSLTLTETEPFKDESLQTDVVGFRSSSWTYWLGNFVKRRSDAVWFQPIGRIGAAGGVEWLLAPADGTLPIDLDAEFSPEIMAFCLERRTQGGLPFTSDTCATITGTARAELRQAVIERRLQHTLTSSFTAKASGELFLYVNDALLMPGLPRWRSMYDNNRGRARLEIARSKAPAAALP